MCREPARSAGLVDNLPSRPAATRDQHAAVGRRRASRVGIIRVGCDLPFRSVHTDGFPLPSYGKDSAVRVDPYGRPRASLSSRESIQKKVGRLVPIVLVNLPHYPTVGETNESHTVAPVVDGNTICP